MRIQKENPSKNDWTLITEKSQRKKIQNRLNQRALRQRKGKNGIQILSGGKSYRVSRWRVEQPAEQYGVQLSISSSPESLDDNTAQTIVHVTGNSTLDEEASATLSVLVEKSNLSPRPTNYPTSVEFPLSSDHLIRLIHQNVFSALMKNKAILTQTTYMTKPNIQGPNFVIPPSRDFCDGLTIIHPIAERHLPQSLCPTPLQMSIPHSSWLNMFPFPSFRDNLIVHESVFDAGELLCDLFGDLVNYNPQSPDESPLETLFRASEDDDDTHARRRGLIVWGESWDSEAWEVTPGFLGKWAWLLEGCEHLIEVTNRWRAKRQEEPLQFGVEEVPD